MDFEHAAQRLAKDQSNLLQNRRRRGAVTTLSEKAKREAEFRKKQQQKVAAERQRQRKLLEQQEAYMTQCERSLGVQQLSMTGPLQLKATSIHGEGDKIALPPSVLEFLTTQQGIDGSSSSPWMFRIAIPNQNYSFPASPVLQTMKLNNDDDDHQMEDNDNDDDEDDTRHTKEAYLDELQHKYLAMTHGGVVEFTQEDGHVGLPHPMCTALLRNAITKNIPVTRTVDPAGRATKGNDDDNGNNDMQIDGNEDKTPGHLAWGAFDVPDVPIEISLVKLPKGKTCRLVPTEDAIRNGFYNLQDIKLVLEQSLIRTRATLSVNDMIHTWHRGTKFDLRVVHLTPAAYQAVSCINTDIEIEFGQVEGTEPNQNDTAVQNGGASSGGYRLGSSPGRTLNETSTTTTTTTTQNAVSFPTTDALSPEPPADQTENIVTIQIRASSARGQRRFDVTTAKIQDLFLYAASLLEHKNFQLVTRFPRKVFTWQEHASMTLKEAGITPGQELFMVEHLS